MGSLERFISRFLLTLNRHYHRFPPHLPTLLNRPRFLHQLFQRADLLLRLQTVSALLRTAAPLLAIRLLHRRPAHPRLARILIFIFLFFGGFLGGQRFFLRFLGLFLLDLLGLGRFRTCVREGLLFLMFYLRMMMKGSSNLGSMMTS